MVNSTKQGLTRREFLVRSGTIAGGTFLAVNVPPSLLSGEAQAAMATPSFQPSIWFSMTPDGITTMHIIKAEMGQHIGTAFAQIIAEELEVPWDKVRLDTPLESAENFGVYGLGLHRQQRQRDHRIRPSAARRCLGPHRADRGRLQSARRQALRLLTPRAAGSPTRFRAGPSATARSCRR